MTKPSRKFQYDPPLFGTVKNPKPIKDQQKSVYYWWWEYLKRNDDYHALIDSGIENEITRDFGDVRNKTFKEWWYEDDRCVRLFAEPLNKIRMLEAGELVEASENTLVLSIPLTRSRDYLLRSYEGILKKYHPGEHGKRKGRVSEAKYSFTGQPNVPALIKDIEAYDLRKMEPELKLFEIADRVSWIGKFYKIDYKKDSKDKISEKKKTLSNQILRHIRNAENAIKATTLGHFPHTPKA